jgi:hypothetical protein
MENRTSDPVEESVVKERVERDKDTPAAATPAPIEEPAAPKRRGRPRLKAAPTEEPTAPIKRRKRRIKQAVAEQKEWRTGRKWPTQIFSLHVQVLTKKPKALGAAIDKVIKQYSEKAQ